MLRMGFIDDVKRVVADTPVDAQRVFFSATLPTEIERIVNQYLVEPVKVTIESRASSGDNIEQRRVRIDGGAKLEAWHASSRSNPSTRRSSSCGRERPAPP